MSSNLPSIEIDAVSKVYRVYEKPSDRLRQMLGSGIRASLPRRISGRWQSRSFGREFWALQDVSFQVQKGESFGILGRNGAGKSTLLQLIAGTLQPTSGCVKARGRIGALLELGSGFNPDFTGRENVYMNAMILGLTKSEVDARFDDIAMFADIGEFLDQPVKTYSSGMMLRLAFAVQTQIRPEILIIDEALAVGDAIFQKRCLAKLRSLVDDGCTLLFVSHDQETIRTMTSRSLLLRDGRVSACGPSSEVVLEYRRQQHADESDYFTRMAIARGNGDGSRSVDAAADIAPAADVDLRNAFGDFDAYIVGVSVRNEAGERVGYFIPGDLVRIFVTVRCNRDLQNLNVNIRIRNKEGVKLYSWGTLNQDIHRWAIGDEREIFWDKSFSAGQVVEVEFEFRCTLGVGFYEVQASVSEEKDRYYAEQRMLHWQDEAAFFQVGMLQREYRFGGVADLRMCARWRGAPE
ncbi:ABC transporter ATP-binding protein [Silanimonas lenta]|uniref:ABC transporter ATP-binding protein n=1 Tax=Silanimonas lenta TaxID=265429 RepID=UPI0004900112|nr:ABC transporter ATP-binding protein [Silanimonas lenta]